VDVECGSGVVDSLGLYAGDAYTDVQDVNARYRKTLTPIRWTPEFDREIYAMEFSVSGVTT
jgi:hypothetical protein